MNNRLHICRQIDNSTHSASKMPLKQLMDCYLLRHSCVFLVKIGRNHPLTTSHWAGSSSEHGQPRNNTVSEKMEASLMTVNTVLRLSSCQIWLLASQPDSANRTVYQPYQLTATNITFSRSQRLLEQKSYQYLPTRTSINHRS